MSFVQSVLYIFIFEMKLIGYFLEGAFLKTALFLLFVLFTIPSFSADLGFRFVNGECVNSKGQAGLNPSFFGPCSDLRGTTLRKLDLSNIDFSGSQFSGADLQITSLSGAILHSVNFEDAILSGANFDEAQIVNSNFTHATIKNTSFSETLIQKSKFATVDFQSNDFSYVKFIDCDLAGANLTQVKLQEAQFLSSNLTGAFFDRAELSKSSFIGSILNGASFESAQLDSANLESVKANKAVFRSASLKKANLSKGQFQNATFIGAKLNDADLSNADLSLANLKSADLTNLNFRGINLKSAIYSKRTVLPFSENQAVEFGMTIQKMKSVLILWDRLDDYVKAFATALQVQSEGEIEVTLAKATESTFTGQEDLLGLYSSIIHFCGQNDQQNSPDLPDAGQLALVKFVRGGGTFIYGEWQAWAVLNGRYKLMRELVLFNRTSGTDRPITITTNTDGRSHPLFDKITMPLSIELSAVNIGPVVTFQENPVLLLATDNNNSAAVGIRKLDEGLIVGLNFGCTYQGSTCLDDPKVRQLYINAIGLD